MMVVKSIFFLFFVYRIGYRFRFSVLCQPWLWTIILCRFRITICFMFILDPSATRRHILHPFPRCAYMSVYMCICVLCVRFIIPLRFTINVHIKLDRKPVSSNVYVRLCVCFEQKDHKHGTLINLICTHTPSLIETHPVEVPCSRSRCQATRGYPSREPLHPRNCALYIFGCDCPYVRMWYAFGYICID